MGTRRPCGWPLQPHLPLVTAVSPNEGEVWALGCRAPWTPPHHSTALASRVHGSFNSRTILLLRAQSFVVGFSSLHPPKALELSGSLGSALGKESHLLPDFPGLAWHVDSGGPLRPEQASLACPWPWLTRILPASCSVSWAGLTTTNRSSWAPVKSSWLCLRCIHTHASALYPARFPFEALRPGSGLLARALFVWHLRRASLEHTTISHPMCRVPPCCRLCSAFPP